MKKEFCCEIFEETNLLYGWYFFEDDDGNKVRVMPYIKDSNLRLNYCPSCGTEIRNIEIIEPLTNN